MMSAVGIKRGFGLDPLALFCGWKVLCAQSTIIFYLSPTEVPNVPPNAAHVGQGSPGTALQ